MMMRGIFLVAPQRHIAFVYLASILSVCGCAEQRYRALEPPAAALDPFLQSAPAAPREPPEGRSLGAARPRQRCVSKRAHA